METKYLKINNDEQGNKNALKTAAELLKAGELCAFPTETVYGLGADATNEAAVAKIFVAKGRPQDNPLIVHVNSKEAMKKLVVSLPAFVDQLIDAFSPGPLTYVLNSNGICAANVTAGLSTVAVRIPDHPVAKMLLTEAGLPIAAPSANVSGKPSPTTAAHVQTDLNGKIAGILDGGATDVGVESTVIDCTGTIPVILRPGGITREALIAVIGDVGVDPALSGGSEKPKSPGMKYQHYAPVVPLILVQGDSIYLQEIIAEEQANNRRVGVLASTETATKLTAEKVFSLGHTVPEIAANLYDGLRSFQIDDVDVIIAEAFSEAGIGEAVMNRLKKAATKSINR